MKKILFATVLIAINVFLSGCTTIQPLPTTEASRIKCQPYPADYQQQIMNYWNRKLIDPSSAQYAFSKPKVAKYKDGYGWLVSVEVNAKNRFGGYVGAKLSQFVFYKGDLKEVNSFSTSMYNSLKSNI